jgi:hypothetical protein
MRWSVATSRMELNTPIEQAKRKKLAGKKHKL